MGYDRTYFVDGDFDPQDHTWGVDCTPTLEKSCRYPEPHQHGFSCDRVCPCRIEEERWRVDL